MLSLDRPLWTDNPSSLSGGAPLPLRTAPGNHDAQPAVTAAHERVRWFRVLS